MTDISGPEIRKALGTIGHKAAAKATFHVNHDACPAGIDGRARLYISPSSTVHGGYVAYCHNCGNHGFYLQSHTLRDTSELRRLMHRNVEARSENDTGFMQSLDQLRAARVTTSALLDEWLARSHLTAEDVESYGIYATTLPDTNELVHTWVAVIPYGARDGSTGFQARRLESDAPMPKYLTYKAGEAPFEHAIVGMAFGSTMVVVEDMLSAIRLVQLGYSVYVCAGAHPNLYTLLEAVRSLNIKDVLVWLDNDNLTVVGESERIYKFLGLTGTRAYRESNAIDPKSYTNDKINTIIRSRCSEVPA